MTDQRIHSVSVAGVVVDADQRVLVVQRCDNGRWEAPGGILEADETFEQGVAREILEETGIAVQVGPLTGVYKNVTRQIVALVYRCTVVSGHARPTDEAAQVRWVSLPEVANLMAPAYAVRIHDAFAPATASRAHDGHDLVTEA